MSLELVCTLICTVLPLSIVLLTLVTFIAVYWYWSWFKPPRFREAEFKRTRMWPFKYVESMDVESDWWLWNIRITTSAALAIIVGALLRIATLK
jgi:hypothetical protein